MSLFTRATPGDLRDDLQALVDQHPPARAYAIRWRQMNDALLDDETVQAVAAGASGIMLTDRRIVQVRGAGRHLDELAIGLGDVRMVQVNGNGKGANLVIRTDGPRILVLLIPRGVAEDFAAKLTAAVDLYA